MIDDAFRRHLPRYTGFLVSVYQRLGLTPNAVSVAGCGLGLLAALGVAMDWPLVAIALWWLGRLLDGTDGIYARAIGQTSAFGAYLDILVDMLAYTVMILAFAALHPEFITHWLLIALLYVLCITSALALGEQERRVGLEPRDERGLRVAAGLAEGGETGIAYTLFLLFPEFLPWLASIWIALLATTVVARTMLAWRRLGSSH